MGLFSAEHMLYFVVVFFLLNATGIWPVIVRALAELRGDSGAQPSQSGPPPSASNLDMCYRLLGISPSAKWEEVERAYRTKAKKHHPDHGGDEDAMRALNEAYAMLKQTRRAR